MIYKLKATADEVESIEERIHYRAGAELARGSGGPDPAASTRTTHEKEEEEREKERGKEGKILDPQS